MERLRFITKKKSSENFDGTNIQAIIFQFVVKKSFSGSPLFGVMRANLKLVRLSWLEIAVQIRASAGVCGTGPLLYQAGTTRFNVDRFTNGDQINQLHCIDVKFKSLVYPTLLGKSLYIQTAQMQPIKSLISP